MNENSEHTATRDVLQSSELTARLLRRTNISPGLLETTMLRQILARLARYYSRPVSLFDELRSRYRIDDDSIDAEDPLVMEQPWPANIYAYLTNSNSFSSTINQFISGVAASFERSGELPSSSATAWMKKAGLPQPS